MPEYDAFGREIGEDPLAGLREATVAEPAATPATEPAQAAPEAVVAEPPTPAPVVARPQFVRARRRRRGGFTGLIVIVALLGLLGNVAVERIEGGIEDIVVSGEPDGLKPTSMIRAANLATALEPMRDSGLGRPLTLRVTPNRVDARLVAGSGRLSLVRVTAQHELRRVGTREGGRPGKGIAYGRIDPTVPERLVRDGDAEGRWIRYLQPDRYGWRAYFRDGSVARGR